MIRHHALWIFLAASLSFGGCAAKQTTAEDSAAAQQDDAQRAEDKEDSTSDADADEPYPDRGARNRQGTQTSNAEVLKVLAHAPTRSEENRARNDARHPAETLDFFGIEPDMTVIEIGPGAGWYAEIIKPFLQKEGRYIAALDAPDGPRAHYRKGWEKLVETQPELFGDAETTVFAPPEYELAEDDSIDLIVTFRHVHGWINDDTYTESFKEFFRVLKPGGHLGVVTHRANPDDNAETSAKDGYVPEPWVIEQAKNAGFELVGQSEINANDKDTKDHPHGVWSLPPTLEGDDEEAIEKAKEIGESDRMTLKFQKPKAD